MANKNFREEMQEVGQWWCFHIKYREKRTWCFDGLAWLSAVLRHHCVDALELLCHHLAPMRGTGDLDERIRKVLVSSH